MKYREILILVFLFLPIFLSSVYAQPQMGKKAPGFTTSTLDGERIALKDYWKKQGGKVIVLSFFATWCQPCRGDIQYLQKVQDQHRNRGLEVFFVLTRDSAKMEAVENFMQELEVELPVLLDENGIIAKRYRVTGLPRNFLIDRKGILKGRYLGYSGNVKLNFEGLLKGLLTIP